jgi:hypothetical protein
MLVRIRPDDDSFICWYALTPCSARVRRPGSTRPPVPLCRVPTGGFEHRRMTVVYVSRPWLRRPKGLFDPGRQGPAPEAL